MVCGLEVVGCWPRQGVVPFVPSSVLAVVYQCRGVWSGGRLACAVGLMLEIAVCAMLFLFRSFPFLSVSVEAHFTRVSCATHRLSQRERASSCSLPLPPVHVQAGSARARKRTALPQISEQLASFSGESSKSLQFPRTTRISLALPCWLLLHTFANFRTILLRVGVSR